MYAVIKTGGKQYRVSPGDLMVVVRSWLVSPAPMWYLRRSADGG